VICHGSNLLGGVMVTVMLYAVVLCWPVKWHGDERAMIWRG
jgi:hypothetical protein